jgi:fructokinase
MSHPLLVVGEALIDVVIRPGAEPVEHVGGSPANVAVGLARLGHDVRFATRVGDDARGTRIRKHLTGHGVRLTEESAAQGPTSVAEAHLDASGAATYTFDLRWDLPSAPLPESVEHVHTGSIATVLEPGADAVLAGLREAQDRATVSYDPNIRPSIMGDPVTVRERVEQIVALSDIVKASDEDLALLYPGAGVPEVLRRWARLGPALTVVTRGAEGVVFGVAGSGEVASAPTRATSVVDTVGAGDSFMAGLLSGLASLELTGAAAPPRLRAATLSQVRPAIDRALATSAATVSRAGAYAPTLDEVG